MYIKRISLFCVIAIHSVLLEVECLLRNKVTDRCIHIENNGSDTYYDVFAKECSWSDVERKIDGNKDQLVELTPRTHGQRQQVTIGKAEDALVCIVAEENILMAGMCNSPSSTFIMKEFPNSNQKNAFTLEHPEGSCVTVEPGTKKLSLRRCIPHDSYQQWTVCRQIGKCDVDSFWSPRGIVFRSNAIIEKLVDKTDNSANTPTPPKENNFKSSMNKIVVSDILYYLQNELSSEKNSEEHEKLVSLMSSFYKKLEVEDGLHILTRINNETSLAGAALQETKDEINVRDSNTEEVKLKIELLINLYKKLNSIKKLDTFTFASTNLSRVPGKISTDSFIAFEKLLTANVDNVISRLENVKNNFNSIFRNNRAYPTLRLHKKSSITHRNLSRLM